MAASNSLHVFISYLREDAREVEKLCNYLKENGIDVWIDRDKILPGERWQLAIRRAIEDGAFFIACFSSAFKDRDRSYMNVELGIAIDQLAKRPADRAWFIPILLEGGVVPDRPIGGGETLRDIQWVDVVSDWNLGLQRILSVIKPSSDRKDLRPDELEILSKTVLIADLVGYTHLFETRDPEILAIKFKQLSDIMYRSVMNHKGHVDSIVGDSLLATFENPSWGIRCAVEIQQFVKNSFTKEDGIQVRIGLAVDENAKNQSNKNFTNLGATLASRICSIASPGQIVATTEISKWKDQAHVNVRELGAVALKGKTEAKKIVEILPIGS